VLTNTLYDCAANPTGDDDNWIIQRDILSCFESIVEQEKGLKIFLGYKHGLAVLIYTCWSPDSVVRTSSLDVLSTLCVEPGAYWRVLEVMQIGVDGFFNELTQAVRTSLNVLNSYKDDVQYRHSSMMFINTITNAPEIMWLRVALRAAYVKNNIHDTFQTFLDSTDFDMENQVIIFSNTLKGDITTIFTLVSTVDQIDVAEVFSNLRLLLPEYYHYLYLAHYHHLQGGPHRRPYPHVHG
jgi:hypothetical protein